MARTIFRIHGSDRRREYIEAFDENLEFITQIISGSDVEIFHPDYGFLLLKEEEDMHFTNTRARRVRALCQLTLGPQLALREIYYTLRNKPTLVKEFSSTKEIYEAVLQSIMHMEIACDIERHAFTVGNRPTGSVFYGHDYTYGNLDKLIGFTEDLARRVLSPWDIQHAQSIVHLEKNTAAGRLQRMGFSKLTNCVLTTAGGNFTRAVYALTERFVNLKPMIFFCDGDAYGNDMLRTLEYGSQNSRHITLDQAFPERRYENICLGGLFPSVAERLGIPNDVSSKRPMSNKYVKQRIEFLKKYDLVDDRDLATWERNKTYELEALSTFYANQSGDPVGLGIYLTELMRIKEIPCKPQPDADDAHEELRDYAHNRLKNVIDDRIRAQSPVAELKDAIDEYFENLIEHYTDGIYKKYKDDLDEALDDTDKETLEKRLLLQYQHEPTKEIYSVFDEVGKLFKKLSVKTDWHGEELVEALKKSLDDFDAEQFEIETDAEFTPLEDPDEELVPFYDIVEEALGADSNDCKAVEEALRWRLT